MFGLIDPQYIWMKSDNDALHLDKCICVDLWAFIWVVHA